MQMLFIYLTSVARISPKAEKWLLTQSYPFNPRQISQQITDYNQELKPLKKMLLLVTHDFNKLKTVLRSCYHPRRLGQEKADREPSENSLEKMLSYKSFLIEVIFLSRFTFIFGTWRLKLSLVRCQEPQNTWKCRAVTDVIKDTLSVRTVHLPHWSNFSWCNCNLDCNLHLILILDNIHTNQKGLDLKNDKLLFFNNREYFRFYFLPYL